MTRTAGFKLFTACFFTVALLLTGFAAFGFFNPPEVKLQTIYLKAPGIVLIENEYYLPMRGDMAVEINSFPQHPTDKEILVAASPGGGAAIGFTAKSAIGSSAVFSLQNTDENGIPTVKGRARMVFSNSDKTIARILNIIIDAEINNVVGFVTNPQGEDENTRERQDVFTFAQVNGNSRLLLDRLAYASGVWQDDINNGAGFLNNKFTTFTYHPSLDEFNMSQAAGRNLNFFTISGNVLQWNPLVTDIYHTRTALFSVTQQTVYEHPNVPNDEMATITTYFTITINL